MKSKKKVFTKNGTLFFPRNQVETFPQMHTRAKLLEGMQIKTILKLLGGYSQIIGEDISLPYPRVWHPLNAAVKNLNWMVKI